MASLIERLSSQAFVDKRSEGPRLCPVTQSEQNSLVFTGGSRTGSCPQFCGFSFEPWIVLERLFIA